MSPSTPDGAPAPDSPERVAVCVCTYRRPEALRRLLDRLVAVARDAGAAARIGVVVVDDDPDGSARLTADRYRNDFELGVAYVHSAAGNISVARNHAIRRGSEVGTWLALIDDDCLPDVGWVRELLVVARGHDADAVSGACVDEPPPGAPSWLTREPFLDDLSSGTDGEVIEIGPLKNTLVSAPFLRAHDLGFDVAMGHAGGEDVLFFNQLARAGARHRFAAAAVVREQVPPERATLGYQLGRRFWYGNTEAITMIATGRASRARVVAGGVKLVGLGIAEPVRQALGRRSPRWRWNLSEILRGIGRVLGALGIKVRHR